VSPPVSTASDNERSCGSAGNGGPLHAVAVLIDSGGCDAHRAFLLRGGIEAAGNHV